MDDLTVRACWGNDDRTVISIERATGPDTPHSIYREDGEKLFGLLSRTLPDGTFKTLVKLYLRQRALDGGPNEDDYNAALAVILREILEDQKPSVSTHCTTA